MEVKQTLAVSEQFYSIQGEGQTIGKPSYFLRLTACNLMCGGAGTEKDGKLHNGATWRCDSIEVWRKGKHKNFGQIVEDFGEGFLSNLKNGVHLIITGGEPLIQQGMVLEFIKWLNSVCHTRVTVEIETNGTIEPIDEMIKRVSFWNVSPKLSNSGEPYERRIKAGVLDVFNDISSTIFKWVISSSDDLEEALLISQNLCFKDSKIWLMPAGSTQDEMALTAPMVAEFCKDYSLNYSHRVHISIWNQKTGV